mgnify:CR=1 FL=1
MKFKKGFTLIELLIVIAIIAILAGVVFVSLDPLTRFRDARDASRWTDVTAVLSAIKVDQVDNRGPYLGVVASAADDKNYLVGTNGATGCNYAVGVGCKVATENNCIDLAGVVGSGVGLKEEGYLGKIPVNPNGEGTWTEAKSGYYVRRNKNNSVSVGSCDTESTAEIEVTR